MRLTTPKKRLLQQAKERLLLAVCRKVLAEAQRAVADGKWVERDMDVKINRLLYPKRCQ